MVKSLINTKWLGRTDKDIKSGKKASPQIDHKFEESLTDQTFNYSIASKVEDFIASGQMIQAAAMQNMSFNKPENQDTFASDNPLTFYGKDLPEEISDIRAKAKEISERLENENLKESERKELEEYLKQLNKAGGKGDGA